MSACENRPLADSLAKPLAGFYVGVFPPVQLLRSLTVENACKIIDEESRGCEKALQCDL